MENCFLYGICNHIDCEADFCIRKSKVEYYLSNAGLDVSDWKKKALMPDVDGTDLAEFKQLAEISNTIVDFVKRGQSLLIYSTQCGNGKTSWAIRLIQSYIHRTWMYSGPECKALFIKVSKLVKGCKDAISNKSAPDAIYADFIMQHYAEADLVVWDDIATKQASAYEIDNILLPMLETRINKTNIFTSNLGQDQMFDAIGERLTSRVFNKSNVIMLRGKDKRRFGRSMEENK